MKTNILLILAVVLLMIGLAGKKEFPKGEWIDLTHDFSDQTLYWTPADGFKKETVAEGKTEQGYYYSAYKFTAPEHGGTHLDSPIHFAEGRQTVDEIPLTQLIAPAVKIDVSAKALADRDYAVKIEDLTNWEAKNRRIPDGSIVLIQTGYGRFWADRKKYMGLEGEIKHFPSLGVEAARWLIENRKIKAVGIDTASIDVGISQNFATHVALMSENIPAFENVANLERLPVKGFQIIALPMKIKGGSGAPLRIVGFIPRN